jgi:hypothetical protein
MKSYFYRGKKMYYELRKIINNFELDGIVVNGKYYNNASLFIINQKPDLNQRIKISNYKRDYRDYISFKFNDIFITGIANLNV